MRHFAGFQLAVRHQVCDRAAPDVEPSVSAFLAVPDKTRTANADYGSSSSEACRSLWPPRGQEGHKSTQWRQPMTAEALSTHPLAGAPSTASGDLLTAEDVAALLRVTPAWVYAQTRRKRIPHLRLGRYVRYRREALDAWMTEVETSSSSSVARHGSGSLAALR